MRLSFRMLCLLAATLAFCGCSATPAALQSAQAFTAIPAAAAAQTPIPTTPPPTPQPTPTAIPPATHAPMPDGLEIIGQCETKIRSKDATHNISLTCEYLNGLLLPPGQSLSLQDTCIKQMPDGYSVDHIILPIPTPKPQGMSQVAGTLHKAALLAGLTIVERKHYRFPAAYLPRGQEAIFDMDTKTDFVIRNDRKEPVWIQAALADKRSKLEIRICGSPWVSEKPIELKSTIVAVLEPPEGVVYLESSGLHKGETVKAKAMPGFRVCVERIWLNLFSMETRTEFLYEDKYEPQQETIYCYKGEVPKE